MSQQKSAIEGLQATNKRVRQMDAQTVLKLPSSAKALIREVADKEGVSDATIIRWALAEWFEKRGYRK